MLRPTLHRILVQPDEQPEQTDSGIIMPQDRDHVPVSGTIVALGPGGSQARYQVRQRAIRDCCEVIESTIRSFGNIAPLLIVRDEVAGMLGSSDPTREVQVGDRVVFPVEVGQKMTQDGVAYILLNEDDVAVVVEEAEAAA